MERVPFGQYKGEEWGRVPDQYLYFTVNKGFREGRQHTRFVNDCRCEVVRRLSAQGKGNADPWIDWHLF